MGSDRLQWAETLFEALGVDESDRAELRSRDLLPLVWEVDAGFVLDANAAVLHYSASSPQSLPRCSDLRTANVALISAARFVPELNSCVTRPTRTDTCPFCGGTGRVPGLPMSTIDPPVCYCGGLGWIPAH